MKLNCKSWRPVLVIAALTLCAAARLSACPACGSANSDMPASPLTDGMNLGILTLFGVIATVLGSIAAFFVFIIRREAALAAKTAAENLSEAKA